MKSFATLIVIGALTVPVWAEGPQADGMDAMKKNEPPAVVHWARGEGRPSQGSKSPNMTSHGGPVMSSVTVGRFSGGRVGRMTPLSEIRSRGWIRGIRMSRNPSTR